MGCQIVLKSLFPVTIHVLKPLFVWLLLILSELLPGLARGTLTRWRTEISRSSAQKWLHGIADLGERSAPYRNVLRIDTT